MTETEALQFLDSLIDYEKITTYSYDVMKLGRMRLLLSALGNPQGSFQSIHVAGSRGKGSTCAMVYHILRETGLSVGLYTSPHLVTRRERIRISKKGMGDRMILDEELASLVMKIKPVLERLSPAGSFTFFELFTALSFLFFKEQGVEVAVVEVGMGGRLDATNLIHPLAAAVTPISFDHMDKLGTTLTAIACEKAQILKRGAFAVISHQEPEALLEIRRVAKEVPVEVLEVPSLYSYRIIEKSEAGTRFHVRGPAGELSDLFLPLLGEHQIRNALVAIAICTALSKKGVEVSQQAIRKGLSQVDWPGRFQILKRNPTLIVDGAQNGASASVLKNTFLDFFKDRPLVLILGISADKEIAAVCKTLCPLAETVIVTQAQTARALDGEILKEHASPYSRDLQITPSLKEALTLARARLGSHGVILVTGSLYLVGEVLELTQRKSGTKSLSRLDLFPGGASKAKRDLVPKLKFL
ncbi:MAG: bifunctional folylpolyglutamate synthase/dihydrofolate synthase [Candidatus Omnitrophica bacterium]|nr:bifunctional folylpolyglutamate synthase/dihydrofolate synthase [Candidatus Omnitrophota bacterium]